MYSNFTFLSMKNENLCIASMKNNPRLYPSSRILNFTSLPSNYNQLLNTDPSPCKHFPIVFSNPSSVYRRIFHSRFPVHFTILSLLISYKTTNIQQLSSVNTSIYCLHAAALLLVPKSIFPIVRATHNSFLSTKPPFFIHS